MEIMMAGPMVRRLLDGTKTQTRRTGARWTKVKPGDVLHVREAFSEHLSRWQIEKMKEDEDSSAGLVFRADQSFEQLKLMHKWKIDWTPAVHMPLHLCRMCLLVKRVWQERADEISEADAVAEGMERVTVEDLLEIAGGSRRLCVNLLHGLHRGRKCSQRYLREAWAYLAQDRWPAMTAQERFCLVLGILGAKPDNMVTAIEFEVIHDNR